MRLIMKRIIIILLTSLVSLAGSAQVDISSLCGKGREWIVSKYGQPISEEICDMDDSFRRMNYDDFTVIIDEAHSNDIDEVTIISDKFCVLSTYFKGGVKVGDSADKLKKYDFAATAYGRNLEINNFRDFDIYSFDKRIDSVVNYSVFWGECYYYLFAVKDNIIQGIYFYSHEDAPAAPDGSYNTVGPWTKSYEENLATQRKK